MELLSCAIEGRIELELVNEESKSEGQYAYLYDNEGRQYLLYRDGELEFDDPYFEEYNHVCVTVLGELIDGRWLKVESVKPIKTDNNEEMS